MNRKYLFTLSHNILFLLITILSFLYTGTAAQIERKSLTFQNFQVIYISGQENVGQIVIKLIENHVPQLSRFYELNLSGTIKIVVTGSANDFRKYRNLNIPAWSGALYFPSKKEMVVKSPTWAGSVANLEEHILHELSHVYFHEKFGSQKLPLWYNEGLAEYLSNAKIDIANALKLANAFATHNLIPFEEIDSLITFSSRSKAELAYLQSLSMVSFLKEALPQHTNWPKFHNLIVQEGWEIALKKSTGMDDLDLEIAWYNFIDKEYRWLLLLNIETLIWPALVVVLIVGFFIIRFRNKRKIRKWNDEESGDSFSDLQ